MANSSVIKFRVFSRLAILAGSIFYIIDTLNSNISQII